MSESKNITQYYLVQPGTNIRMCGAYGVYIFSESVIDYNITPNWEKISVADYDAKYKSNESNPAVIPTIHPIIPTLYTDADSIDLIHIRQIGTNCYVTNNGKDIAMISGIHADLWAQRNYPLRLVNFADQLRGGQIYFTVVITQKEGAK